MAASKVCEKFSRPSQHTLMGKCASTSLNSHCMTYFAILGRPLLKFGTRATKILQPLQEDVLHDLINAFLVGTAVGRGLPRKSRQHVEVAVRLNEPFLDDMGGTLNGEFLDMKKSHFSRNKSD